VLDENGEQNIPFYRQKTGAGLRMTWRPRVFVSYAREDHREALQVAKSLEGSGIHVFMDTKGLMIGDQFATRLSDELKTSDGLVFLHTAMSARSEWCHAEIYAAYSRGLQLLRIRKGECGRLPDPIERFLSDLHYLEWQEPNPPDLVGHLKKAARHARRRAFMRLALGASAAAVFGAIVTVFFLRWDAWQASTKRRQVIDAIETSQAPWTGVQVKSIASGLAQDGELISRVRALRDDPRIVQLAPRLNAWQVDQLLSAAQGRRERWDLSGADWRGASLDRAVLSDVTIREGRIESFTATRCQLAGIYFGPGPGAETQRGLSLIDARFDGCDFWNVWIDRTQLLTTEFRNSKFRGADISVLGMAGAKFYSAVGDVNVVKPDFALFENSIIRGKAPPDAGVMDLSTPEQEVLFDKVEFKRVTFEGWFKPGWFRDSHFDECNLPASLSRAALAGGGNRVD